MKKRRILLVSLFLIFVVSLTLTGCGGSSGGSSPPGQSGSSSWDELKWDEDKWG